MKNNKLYVVTWGTASVTDEGAGSAYCGCVGCFTDRTAALGEMTKYKDSYVKSLIEDVEDEEEREEIENSIKVYGSETEEYYEVDFTITDSASEHFIRIEEIIVK